jgi:hypothetical protein
MIGLEKLEMDILGLLEDLGKSLYCWLKKREVKEKTDKPFK